MTNTNYPTCQAEASDGNNDDPTFWFCGYPQGHAGECGDWEL